MRALNSHITLMDPSRATGTTVCWRRRRTKTGQPGPLILSWRKVGSRFERISTRGIRKERENFCGQYLPVSLYIEVEGPSSKQKRLPARRSHFHPRPTEEVIKGESRYLYIPIYKRRNKKAGPKPGQLPPPLLPVVSRFFCSDR